jgi:uncharacterized protein YyaL (SSP411 family)
MPLLREIPRNELGPYLRQHADNPVDWYAWGDDAFEAARDGDRPVLLSVGYSACHWCHVMAHESFEDPDVAALMNRLFVNVKVDREERPDVDAIYMQAVQALTGSGGWPMTVFLAPDGTPFFGGTYFPKEDRHGLVGFPRLVERIDEAWRTQRPQLLEQGERLRELIARSSSFGGSDGDGDGDGEELTAEILTAALSTVGRQFDRRFGGFGRAPKFPPSTTLDFLLRAQVRDPDPATLEMVTTTLDAMAAGGIWDQVGGGFHRYSVDDHWLVPHFEKMLYDQALLLGAYTHGWLVTGEDRYRRVADELVGYVLRDLRHPDGGFYAAEDADSEGVEGKFYCWSLDEIEERCGDDAAEVIRYFGVTRAGNFEDPHTGYRGNILHVVDRTEDHPPAVERCLPGLREARATRVRPGLDDKVLLGWNALFVRGLTDAAGAFDRSDWLDAARATARFLLAQLRRPDGRFLHSWQSGTAQFLAYAEDYAALLEALLSLAEIDDVAWLDDAREVADRLLALFSDDEHGGFFTTGVDAEALIVRPKDVQDGATPSANSLAAHGLLRLAALTGESRYENPPRRWLEVLAPVLGEHPTAFAYLLAALERSLAAPLEVALIGDGSPLAALRREVLGRLLPDAVTLSAPPGHGGDRSPLLAGRSTVDGQAAAYVCERYACRAPVTSPEALRAELDAALTASRPGDRSTGER